MNPETLNARVLSDILDKAASYLPTLGIAAVVYIIGFFINKFVMRLLGKGLAKSKIEKTVHGFISSSVKIVLYSLILIISLTILGIPMTSIIAVIGSAGIAIGLAMKDSLSNVAGGLILLITKPFKAGDYIEIDGFSGTVDEISIMTTKLITPDNKAIFIPNGYVSGNAVTNYSACEKRRVEYIFKISVNNDYEKAVKILTDIISADVSILKDPEPFVRMTGFNDKAMEITVRAWVNSPDYWTVYHNLIESAKNKFDESSITIPSEKVSVFLDRQ